MGGLASRVAAAIVALLLAQPLQAGGGGGWEEWLDDIAAFDDWSAGDREQAYDMLCDLEAHPLNINAATRDELGRLPFLTEAQVSDIQEHIYRHGAIRTMGELQLIESLDYARRRLLQCFAYAGEPLRPPRPTAESLLRGAHGDVTAMVSVPMYDRRGDRNGYLGYKYRHWLRFGVSSAGRLRAGFAASQDAGEPFFSGSNSMGYDFYSFFIEARRLGPVERIVVGRYTVSFGMGLVANTGFSLGKLSALATMGRAPAGIRATASRSEASYLQGAAVTLRLSDVVSMSVFASYRAHDATLNADDGTVATIVTSGYHRTKAEMEKKNNTHSAAAGIDARFAKAGFHAGLTAVYTRYDRDLRPDTATLYRRHYASGNDFANIGANYGYESRSFSVGGETAVDRRGRVAAIHRIGARLSEAVSLVAVHRFYSYRYTSVYANSFSEGGRVQNESGIYAGAEWRPGARLRLAAYADHARFAWPRYRVSWPSAATDAMLSAAYDAGSWALGARYRLRLRKQDNSQKTGLESRTVHTARVALDIGVDGKWSGRTQADMSLAGHGSLDRGLMVSQGVGLRHGWLQADAFVAYFNTDSYDSRLYVYERGMAYSFYMPAYHGHGMRGSLMARADVGKRLMVAAKVGMTAYFDRDTIGSGYRQVDGSTMVDIDLQARWSF